MTAGALEPIAVVGLACRMPGAVDEEQFWQNLAAGEESIEFDIPETVLHEAGVSDEELANPDYVRAASTLSDFDLFDAGLFRMTRREAEICDPQIRLFLETSHSALENAGYDPFDTPDSVGVFGSVGASDYLAYYVRQRPDVIESARMLAMTLNRSDYLATLTAYKLNLRGPAMTVLCACSSSLVSIHVACQSLRLGECDTALAGGSHIGYPPRRGHLWTPGGVSTHDGHCRPFDADATGTIFGSGVGVVVLKRLDDALSDGDNVRAVVLGSAVNNDGSQKVSFSAPSVSGQVAAITEAMVLAGVAPTDVGFVEAHATGTVLGDPVEVAALTEAYTSLSEEPLPTGYCALGSVKGNIGHMDDVAGVAAFIKTVLALEREAIPGTVNLKNPNPRLNIERTPFKLNTRLQPWPRSDRRRLAGVTSLGMGGTNAHVVLAEGPVPVHAIEDGRLRLVPWSARSEATERQLRERLSLFFGGPGQGCFTDAVGTLQHGRTAHPVRAALVCDSAEAARAGLAGERGAPAVITGQAVDDCRVAYLLPGQGSQHVRMAHGLYGTVRAFTVSMDECLELFEERGVPLYKIWSETTGEAEFADPGTAQPLLFSVEYALAEMWRQWGVQPAAVLGHSLGELTAAAVARVFSLPDAVALVAARAAAMAEFPVPGSMLAVGCAEPDVLPYLDEPLVLAAVNAERQVVVSGPDAELRVLADRLGSNGIATRMVSAGAAFHHPGYARAAAAWAEAFRGVNAEPPRVPFYSALTGARVEADRLADPEHWTGQLAAPVRFHDALGALLDSRPDALLEVGPRRVLSDLARKHPRRDGTTRTVASLRDGQDDHADVLAALGRLWVAGAEVNWTATGQLEPMVRVTMPGYPYDRSRYWVDRPPLGRAWPEPAAPRPNATEPPLQVADAPAAPVTPVAQEAAVTTPFTEIGWVETVRPRPDRRERSERRALVLLPDDPAAASMVLLAVQRAGLQPVRVRRGTSFSGGPVEFRVRPGELDDLDRVLGVLRAADTLPDVVIHALDAGETTAGGDTTGAAVTGDGGSNSLGRAAARLGSGFAELLATCRLVLTSGHWSAPPRLTVVASRSTDVSGADPVQLDRAALHGLVRTVRAEDPGLRVNAIDVDPLTAPGVLADELAARPQAPLVALRGLRRWVAVERPLPLPTEAGALLRERGVYLITGGLGGLGLEMAKGLAASGLRPTLALLSRRAVDQTHAAVLDEVRALGADVVTYACDVTDGAAVERVVTEVTARYGPVNGLFHLAGVPGDRMTAFREPADALAVLAPKTIGTACLERVLGGRPGLDFAVFFSSRAAAEGLVGGGDYAVANAFLDAAARTTSLAGGRVLSVGWPVWRGTGMAVRSGVDISGLGRSVRELSDGRPETGDAPPAAVSGAAGPAASPADPVVVWEREMSPATDWVLDEHRMDRTPLLVGTAYLDLIVRVFRERAGDAAEPAVEITDVLFRAPFLDQRRRLLRLTFRPAGDRYDVVVDSRLAGEAGPWTVHVTAQIRGHSGAAGAVALGELRDRFVATSQPTPGLASSGGTFVIVTGPRWRNIPQSWTVGSESLLRVELRPAYRPELDQHALHPAMMDTVTAAVRGPGQASSIPFMYQRLVVHSDLPAQFYAHVKRDVAAPVSTPTGDVDLIADDGTLLATVEGFTMMMIDDDQVKEAARSSEPVRVSEPVRDIDGLDPETGVELMLGLLESGVTGTVLVRPFAAGRPVPLPERAPGDEASVPAPPATGFIPVGGAPADVPPARGVLADVRPVGATNPGDPGHRGPSPAGHDATPPMARPLEERVGALWRRALGTDEVLADQDFFDAGGNSLTAVELMARIRSEFGVQLNIGLLLETRTFAELVEAVRERSES
ncbi:SDR family NAD(P)-dependent oxidoreductase [Plantactinospora sp. WMMB782]|uniref:type I polyketide synthase n=1 Tax=Plantactinospora sp. WMMB782 TaxID=3404121 RepID=UPI003B962367